MNTLADIQTVSDDDRWTAVVGRDPHFDGRFVYAVATTGIYCRPSCPSRRPGRQNVSFYALPEAAEQGGFRACRRCKPRDAATDDPTIATVRAACRFIETREEGPPTLEAVADHVGASPFHLQRTFKRIMGISPRQYADAVRLARFRTAVRDSGDVTDALYEAGYGSSSRLYEQAGRGLGMTPATYGKGGAGAHIRYAVADCFLGRILVAATETGICFLAFGDDDERLARELAAEFPAAEIGRDDATLGAWVEGAAHHLSGDAPHPALPLDVRATAFQRRVWEALSDIPHGETRSYSEIAAALGTPTAQRAVGRACATNPVSLLIPCHRAVREDGGLGGYRWGLARKEQLLAHEKSGETS